MHQIDQVFEDDGGGLAGGADLAGAGSGDDAVRLRGARTRGEVGIGDTAETGGETATDEAFHVDGGVLQQFERDGDDLRAELVGLQRDDAERGIGAGGGGVFTDQLAGFRGSVGGREVDVVAGRSAEDFGDFTHAAVGLEGVGDAGGDFGGDGVAALRRGADRHGVAQDAPLFRGHQLFAILHQLPEGVEVLRTLLVVGLLLDDVAHGVSFSGVLDGFEDVIDALDFGVDVFDFGHGLVVGCLVIGVPLGARIVFEQLVEVLGEGGAALPQSLDGLHTISFREIRSKKSRPEAALLGAGALRQLVSRPARGAGGGVRWRR